MSEPDFDLDRLIPPRRLAAAARALHPRVALALASSTELIESELVRARQMVAWDRVRLIGQAQQRLAELKDRRAPRLGGGGVRIVERRDQPLECIPAVWSQLRAGRPVVLSAESGALTSSLAVMRAVSTWMGPPLRVCGPGDPWPEDATDWPLEGVAPAARRVALVQADADPEVAAYLLARACLRRTGFDPRAVHRVVVVGERPRFLRHLRRLWLGASMGPPDAADAFAGPVDEGMAQAYRNALEAWAELPGVDVLCDGGELSRGDAAPGRRYLAPSLLRLRTAEAPASPPECAGPMLVLEEVEPDEADRRLRALADETRGTLWLRFGRKPRGVRLGPEDRQIEEALLVEQLPPGLPAPRP